MLFRSLPLRPGDVTLNAESASLVTVEIADAQFRLLPDFSGVNAGATAVAGGLDCPVRWPKGALKVLGGKTVRLRLQLRKQDAMTPRVYAVSLK